MSGSLSFNQGKRDPRPQQRAIPEVPPAPDTAPAQPGEPTPGPDAAGEGAGLLPFLVLAGLAAACAALRALIFWPSF